jgi:glycosyltransferase involved in cell wall biosynthesis
VALYVTPSDFTTEMYMRGGWDPGLLTTIPNFVHPDPGPGSGAGGFALFVGRLAPPKGLEILLRAWRDFGVGYPLKIVGDGPLRPLVEDAEVHNPLITYLGPVPPAEALELMGDATFVIVPTVGAETFGRVAAEAFAKGTPALVSDLGGLSEIVDDGVTGWRVTPGDAVHLADRVAWMIEHPEDVAVMRGRVRSVFLEKYSSERAIGQWIAAYGRAIETGTR